MQQATEAPNSALLQNDAEAEFASALGEVGQIARFRIAGMFPHA